MKAILIIVSVIVGFLLTLLITRNIPSESLDKPDNVIEIRYNGKAIPWVELPHK
jgi:hypothetical protein